MIHEYPNLRVYVDRKVIRYLPSQLSKNSKYIVSFYISLDEMNFLMGEKIEVAIRDISNSVPDFKILPVPRCLFKTDYPKSISKRMVDEPRKFLMDGHDFRLFFDEEVKELRDRLKLLHKCSECKFKKNSGCEGIYGVEPDKVRSEKTCQWLFDDIPKHGKVKLLDLGCGDSPFLPVLYTKLAREDKSLFFCVDPSDISIRNLKGKIPEDLRSNILTLMGIGEYLPLSNGIFDFVLFHYSYSHFMDIEKTIKNIYRILKKGGILLIFEDYHPEKKVISEIKKKSWKDVILNRIEFRNHSLQDAIKILEPHCFEILDSFEGKGRGRVSWGIKSKKI